MQIWYNYNRFCLTECPHILMVPAFDKKSYISTWQCEQYEKQGQALYFTMQ